jgi:hypothetical protein
VDAYILDAQSEIYVWLGTGCNQTEKNEAMACAKKFLAKYNRPRTVSDTHTLVILVEFSFEF